MAGHHTIRDKVRTLEETRVKNAVRMRAFSAPGRICHRNYTRYQNKLDSGCEIKKSKLHTQKISLEFHEHKLIGLVSLFCTTYFPPLHQRRKSCLKVYARFRFILKSNINTENGDARI